MNGPRPTWPGTYPSLVAAGSQVLVFAGLIAADLPDGSEVLTPLAGLGGRDGSGTGC
jgi:hypothetical protein